MAAGPISTDGGYHGRVQVKVHVKARDEGQRLPCASCRRVRARPSLSFRVSETSPLFCFVFIQRSRGFVGGAVQLGGLLLLLESSSRVASRDGTEGGGDGRD